IIRKGVNNIRHACDEARLVYGFAISDAVQDDVEQSFLILEPHVSGLRVDLNDLHGPIKLDGLICDIDHPVCECAQKVSFSKLHDFNAMGLWLICGGAVQGCWHYTIIRSLY